MRFLTTDLAIAKSVDLALIFFIGIFLKFPKGAVWVAFILLSLFFGVGGLLQMQVDPLGLLHAALFYLLFPIVYAYNLAREGEQKAIQGAIFITWSLVLFNFAVLPIELAMRGGIHAYVQLQFSGRSYELPGLLLICLSIASLRVGYPRIQLIIALCATSFLSLSRGAMFVSLLMTLTYSLVALRDSGALRYLVALGLASLAVISIGLTDSLTYFVDLLSVRLNLSADATREENFAGFMHAGGRWEIWSYAWDVIGMRPVFGIGVGQSPAYIKVLTEGASSYSGFHGFFLTLFAERGILFGLFVLVAFTFSAAAMFVRRKFFALITFLSFVIYSNVTGVESVMAATAYRNGNTTILLILLVYLSLSGRFRV